MTMRTTIRINYLLMVTAAVISAGCGGGVASVPQVTAIPSSALREPIPPDDWKRKGEPGTFSGRIVYVGTPPAIGQPPSFDPKDAKTDKYCASHHKQVRDLSLVVNPTNNGLKNVFVYLVRKPKGYKPPPAPSTRVVFDQQNCTFLPHALLVRTEQPIEIRNSDQTSHNTHTNPGGGENPINTALSANQRHPFSYSVSQVVPVSVACDIHNWMNAYHLPLDHDLAAITDENGRFRIDGLPPGDYSFRIWHELADHKQYLVKNYAVTIEPKQTVHEELKFKASRFAH